MPSPEPWVLRIDPGVLRKLKKIPKGGAKRILRAIKELPLNPYYGDIQKMKGQENVWRRRIGSYRFFYKLFASERVILVFHLERRTSTTY
ncbi:MAG: type II toxin-antitoxin system RelE/ParE family toxin [Acidobacteria bacterium]|nr:type II toxin-antitoxin system RelE/ParE family toxin [Acidobacteriota bacterium]